MPKHYMNIFYLIMAIKPLLYYYVTFCISALFTYSVGVDYLKDFIHPQRRGKKGLNYNELNMMIYSKLL